MYGIFLHRRNAPTPILDKNAIYRSLEFFTWSDSIRRPISMSVRNAIAIFAHDQFGWNENEEWMRVHHTMDTLMPTFAIFMDTVAVSVAIQYTISISVSCGTVADRMFAVAVGHFRCIGRIAANRNVALLVAFWGGRRTVNFAKQAIVRIVMRTSCGLTCKKRGKFE